MSSMLDDDYLTVAEAAAMLRVNQSTIRRWIANGDLPASRIGHRRLALRRADLARLVTPLRPAAAPAETMIHTSLPWDRMRPEEQRRARAAVEAARRLQAEQLARRGGKPFPSSWALINEERDKRSEQLS